MPQAAIIIKQRVKWSRAQLSACLQSYLFSFQERLHLAEPKYKCVMRDDSVLHH